MKHEVKGKILMYSGVFIGFAGIFGLFTFFKSPFPVSLCFTLIIIVGAILLWRSKDYFKNEK